MSSIGDDNGKELTEKLKKAMKSPDWPANVVSDIETCYGLQLSPAFLQQLHKNNMSTSARTAAIRQLTITVKEKIIKEEQVEQLWLLMEDLLSSDTPEDHRNPALALLTAVAVSSNASKKFGGTMRHIVFNYVSSHCETVAIEPLFDLFSAALSEGKNLELVEDLVCSFYANWYPKVIQTKKVEAAIRLFMNLIKTNAAFLDEPELLLLVKATVWYMNSTFSEKEAMLCVTSIETVVAYCHLPSIMMISVVASIAKIVSVPTHSERVWKLMRNILGTYLGQSALFTLAELIKSPEIMDPHITRGCVYFLHTALWGPKAVTSLEVPYHFALPVLLKASENCNELVIYEVAFAMKLLVGKLGVEIHPQAWEDIFKIVSNLYKYTISLSDGTKAQAILNVVNDTVDFMEMLRDQDQFCVLRETFYNFLSPFSLLRTESSALGILDFLVVDIVEHCKKDDFLTRLGTVLRHYFNNDLREPVRLRAAKWMADSLKNLGKKQGTEVIIQIILPAVREYRTEPLPVRCAVVDVLGFIVYEHNHPIITECLHLLMLTITDPFKEAYDDDGSEVSPDDAGDVIAAVDWLILVFKRRMWDLPSTDAITAFRSLLTFLESHYSRPNMFLKLRKTRSRIFEMIFQIRANHRYEIGLPGVADAQINYGQPPIPGLDTSVLPLFTPYVIIDHKHGQTLAVAASTSSSESTPQGTQTLHDAALRSCSQVRVADGVSFNSADADISGNNQSSDVSRGGAAGPGVCDEAGAPSSLNKRSFTDSPKVVTTDSNLDSNILDGRSCPSKATPENQTQSSQISQHSISSSSIDDSYKLDTANHFLLDHTSGSGGVPSNSAGGTQRGTMDDQPSEADDSIGACLSALGKVQMMQSSTGVLYFDGVPPLPKTDDPWREAQRCATITYLSLTEAAATVIVAMKKEKDWDILKMILEGIPKMLQNKALIVSRDSNDIDYFADALTSVILDRTLNLPASLYNTPEKFMRPDFEMYVFLALSCLSCYRRQLSMKWQSAMVSCLTNGMVSKCGGVCMSALTLCCLEMPQTMVRSLPSILHSLTKISATVHSSQPVLEFLSTLLHLPHIYSNFSSEQYMAVFAIVIPYTNPIKFNQYVVILAFHVLAMWFLKCKINSRRHFVNFITKNLKNVLGPEDMKPRRRSASLTDQVTAPDRTEIFVKLHADMRMILTDLMSRYAFASCTPTARRSEVGEALVGSGQQQTWLVGLKLFTITVSGCSQRPMTLDGLCENCHAVCSGMLEVKDKAGSYESDQDKDEKASTCELGTDMAGSSGLLASDEQSMESLTKAMTTSTPITNNPPIGVPSSAQSSQPQASSDQQTTVSGCIGQPTSTQSQVSIDQQPAASGAASQPTSSSSSQSHGSNDPLSVNCSSTGRPLSTISTQSQASSEPVSSNSGEQAVKDNHLCTCWCIGYSEVYVRQPTGNMVWMMRLQNHQQILEEGKHLSVDDLAALYGPSVTPQQHPTHLTGSGEPIIYPDATSPPGSNLRRRQSGGRRNSDGSTAGLARSTSNNSVGSPDAEARKLVGLTDTIIVAGVGHTLSVDEVEEEGSATASDERVSVQRSQSNPEIGDGDLPLRRKPTESKHIKALRLDQCPGATGTSSAAALKIITLPESNVSVNVSVHNPPITPKTPLELEIVPSSQSVGKPGGATSPSVPQSPSKLFSRIGSKFNSNINKFFGNPSSSSSGTSTANVVSFDNSDAKRLRHSSELSSTNTSASQPNVSAQQPQRVQGSSGGEDCDVLAPIRRGRGHTISVMNPASRPPPPTMGTPLSPLSSPPSSVPSVSQLRLQEIFSKPWSRPQPGTTTHDPRAAAAAKCKEKRGGVTPSNVVLQLLYSGNPEKSFDRPLLVPMDQEEFKRSVDVLDYTPPLENHCIGVLYVGPGQTTEQEILGNLCGSMRYNTFLRGLGTVVSVKKASKGFFLPGLSDKGDDGNECYVWQDEIMQVAFHVATVMPNRPDDPRFTAKKRHIGNDFVTIVYNNSGQPYNRDTIKTQFNNVIVEIRPAEHETNIVHQILKPQIREVLTTTPIVRLVSDANLALYVRQIALHSVIACRVQQQLHHPEPYAGNWLRRLRTTFKLRQRLLDRLQQMEEDDTTDFMDML